MKVDRRQFLKIAGLSAIAGIGGTSAASLLSRPRAQAAEFLPSPKALKAKRWAMVVDTRKFQAPEDFKRCIDVCHKIHNVPNIGNKQEVKWIWTEHYHNTFPSGQDQYLADAIEHQNFLVFCNHCDNPPCVRVCPTKATYKRPDGIVAMDYHRCIGCRFCMAACPFGSRSFNWGDPRPYIKEENLKFPTRMKGVVEKCNFCVERLAEGLKPACVEASNGGLVFGDLADPDSEVRELLRTNYTIRRKPELGTQPCVYYIV